MRVLHALSPLILVASYAIPFGLGVALTGSVYGGLTALLWGGLIRVVLQSHVTWSVNSVCHFFGRRRFEIEDESGSMTSFRLTRAVVRSTKSRAGFAES